MGQLAAGYQSVQKETDAVVAKAKVAGEGQAAFAVEDRWKICGRRVVAQPESERDRRRRTNAGFYSAIRLLTAPTVGWDDVDYLAPGLLYGDPHTEPRLARRQFELPRQALLDTRGLAVRAALCALVPGRELGGGDGHGAARRHHPGGDHAPAATPIIDERIQFGALGAREIPGGGSELGFWLPGTTNEFSGGRVWRRARGTERSCGAAALSSGQGGVLAELSGGIPLRAGRVLPRHGTRCLALGVADPEAAR